MSRDDEDDLEDERTTVCDCVRPADVIGANPARDLFEADSESLIPSRLERESVGIGRKSSSSSEWMRLSKKTNRIALWDGESELERGCWSARRVAA